MAPAAHRWSGRRDVLLGGSLWSLTASLASGAGQWGLLVIAARLGSPEMVGRYALAAALVGPPLLLANLQLRSVLVSDTAGRFAWNAYRKLRAATTALATIVVAILAGLAGVGGEAAAAVGWLTVIRVLDQAADLYHAVLQKNDRLRTTATLAAVKTAASLAVFAAALAAAGWLSVALAAIALVDAAVLAGIERPAGIRFLEPPRRRTAGGSTVELARRAFPLGLVATLISIHGAIPRYFLAWRQGPAALGYFTALSTIPFALHAVTGAAAQAWLAPLARSYAADRAVFGRLTLALAALAASLGVAAIAATPWLGRLAGWLYRPDYARHPDLLFWLTVAGAASALGGVLGAAVTAAGGFAPQPASYALAAAVCAVGCFLWVDASRPAAPAQALAASSLIVIAGHAALLRRLMGRRHSLSLEPSCNRASLA